VDPTFAERTIEKGLRALPVVGGILGAGFNAGIMNAEKIAFVKAPMEAMIALIPKEIRETVPGVQTAIDSSLAALNTGQEAAFEIRAGIKAVGATISDAQTLAKGFGAMGHVPRGVNVGELMTGLFEANRVQESYQARVNSQLYGSRASAILEQIARSKVVDLVDLMTKSFGKGTHK